MPKVICKLPNASDEISGVKFTDSGNGFKISEDVGEDVAAAFAGIAGYELADPASEPAPKRKYTKRAKPATDEADEGGESDEGGADEPESETVSEASDEGPAEG